MKRYCVYIYHCHSTMSLSLYYHTLKYLKQEQLFFQIYYKIAAKVTRFLSLRTDYTCYKKGNPVELKDYPKKPVSYEGDNVFCLLNLTHRFNGKWDDCSQGELWRYNLNYMDFLLQPGMSVTDGYGWIERFIDDIADNQIANDPYPISLRGINWIKFVSLHIEELSFEQMKKIDTSLYSQYKLLSKRTERHLLANHYLENGFSLLFAAIYFRDADFWQKAKHIVVSQLKEQILSDGAHFELSPMYHCVILERLLDCCNLLSVTDNSLFVELETTKMFLYGKASEMLAWLDAIVVANDTLPLLNDAANGVVFSPSVLREYANSLHIEWHKGELNVSGYRHITRSAYETIIDIAPLGVSYNLGHAHADTSNFLLWVRNRALLVDTGTSTYNNCERRNYERSTMAHNAVVVDGENSSKVWGAFRCAQRANVNILDDTSVSCSMSHNGYNNKGVTCLRQYICREDRMEVIDTVSGGHIRCAVAYFHLAPEVQVLDVSDNAIVTDCASFYFENSCAIDIVQMEVAEEYNILSSSQCIQVTFDSTLRTIIADFQ